MDYDIIKLTTEDGSIVEYYVIGDVRYKGDAYSILRPVLSSDDDNFIVCSITQNPDGSNTYNADVDDKTAIKVMKKHLNFLKLCNGEGRPIGHPMNMLLDVGVMIVLLILASWVQNFLAIIVLMSMIVNCGYFVVHLVSFLLGKR